MAAVDEQPDHAEVVGDRSKDRYFVGYRDKVWLMTPQEADSVTGVERFWVRKPEGVDIFIQAGRFGEPIGRNIFGSRVLQGQVLEVHLIPVDDADEGATVTIYGPAGWLRRDSAPMNDDFPSELRRTTAD